MLYYLIFGLVSMGLLVLQSYLFYKERSKLLNRIMSRDFEQYEYYEKMFKGEVKELKEQRKEVKEEGREDTEIKKELDLEYKAEKEFIAGTEEDWEEEEIDLEKLREKIGKK